MHHVIVGSGPAGVTAAETIRSICKNSKITLIGGEGEPPYSRMAIPYLLHGDIQEKGTYLRQSDGHYDGLGIDYKQARIAGIDATKKQLWTSNIEPIAYDKLLLATGATPIIPRMEGADLPGVHTCWTLSDARAIAKLVGKGTPVVLVGAGFIGSIVLEALHKTGAQLTVVEIAPRMVARMMDETAGGMLGRWCTEHGVRVLTNTKVERISNGSGVGASARLKWGSRTAERPAFPRRPQERPQWTVHPYTTPTRKPGLRRCWRWPRATPAWRTTRRCWPMWPAWRSTACRRTTSATALIWRFSAPRKSGGPHAAASTNRWTLPSATCRRGM